MLGKSAAFLLYISLATSMFSKKWLQKQVKRHSMSVFAYVFVYVCVNPNLLNEKCVSNFQIFL